MALSTIIGQMAGRRVAVLGDLICDRFIYGEVDRISPEAPVPVMRAKSEEILAGGAANVAHNVVTLLGRADIFGIVGDDADGRKLMETMHGFGAGVGGVLTVSGRPTTVKTRMVAQTQQLMRLDYEVTGAIDARAEDSLLASLKLAAQECDLLVLSDYDKGVLTKRLAQDAIAVFKAAGKRTVCDPKPANIPHFSGVSIMTPNRMEALLATGINRVEPHSMETAGRMLQSAVGCEAVAITAGADGIYLLAGETYTHIPGEPVAVYDVVGAGDTVCAAMALALAAGAKYEEAAALANYAGAIVVGKLGLATVNAPELLARVDGK
jgi:D-beta-D-heptose 7-phosphate kinase/D-beta-D-heptose 1-phosphate adenosyltransferase